MQRTRSSASPPHSPLTRHPLGSRNQWPGVIAGVCLAVALVALPVPGRQEPGRSPAAVETMEVTATNVPALSIDPNAERSWKVTLRDPGDSYLDSGGEKQNGPSLLSVPKERLATLRSVISTEAFFRLKDSYGYFPVDGPERRMAIRIGGKLKKVTINSIRPDMTKQEALEVDRAMRVWFAIMDCFKLPKRPAA